MYKHNLYPKASTIALAIATVTIYTTGLPVSAQFDISNDKRDTHCMNNDLHTRNFCDGYFVGNGDCENNNTYRGNSNAHTEDWRSGYFEGYVVDSGCALP
jgi:hypothetical protein